MENTKIVQSIIAHIENHAKTRNLTQAAVAETCERKGIDVSQGTISNMFKTPSSTTLSTLLKVCDGLDLNLLNIFNQVYRTHLSDYSKRKLIYNVDDDAYNGYMHCFHVYFFPTNADNHREHLHGTLLLDDVHGECHAHLMLDTGSKTKSGEPFIKEYDGQFVISKSGCAYCNLVSNKLGDMWSLVLNHDYLNENTLICALANAVTGSAGKVRYPTVHRALISRDELDTETLKYISGMLRLSDDQIIISATKYAKFLEKISNLPSEVTDDLNSMKDESECYISFSKKVLETKLLDKGYAFVLSELLNFSTAPKNNQVTDDEDTIIFQIIANSTNKLEA